MDLLSLVCIKILMWAQLLSAVGWVNTKHGDLRDQDQWPPASFNLWTICTIIMFGSIPQNNVIPIIHLKINICLHTRNTKCLRFRSVWNHQIECNQQRMQSQSRGEQGSWGELGLFTFNLFPSPDGDSNNNLYWQPQGTETIWYVFCQNHCVFHSYPSIKYEFNACIS